VAIVVGAAGMGEAVATRLARDGYDVILLDPRDCRAAVGRIETAIRTASEPTVDDPGAEPDAAPITQSAALPDGDDGNCGNNPNGPNTPNGNNPPPHPQGNLLAASAPLGDPADLRRVLPGILREAGHGPAVDAVVYTLLADDAFTPRPVAGLSAADWDRLAEEPVRWGLTVLQVAHEYLLPRKGRFVFVLPSVALEGGAGLVPLATSAESLRALGKSAARRWAGVGITVNFVLPDVFAYGAEQLRGTDVDRGEAVLPEPGTASDVADTVALFLAPDAARLTGATLTVDGGALMTP
jgi:NAD(P)-dependent dehydrogenase (short-subunit alcohol dehydrogenase family)